MLAVKSLTRTVGSRSMVSEVSFDMAAGEILAILGPSGSGKTSLLRMIAGFDAPTRGSVQLHGREVSAAGKVLVAPEQRALSLAFQDATLFAHLDAVGNVAFAVRAADKAARTERARAALRDMGLTQTEGRDVATLSGGEAQRVKLALELSKRDTGRTLYILDEPTTGLHFADIQLLLQVLHQLCEAGNTVVVIEHNLDVIKTADWLLDMGPEGGAGGGTLLAAGTPEDIAACAGSHTGRFLRPLLAPVK